MKLIEKINYALLLSALIIIFIELYIGYIGLRVFLHCLLTISILCVVRVVMGIIKVLDKTVLKAALCLIMLFINYVYAQFFYEINVTLLIVPENFKDNISVLFGALTTNNPIRPLNKTLTIKVDKNGAFQTSSKYKIALYSIIIAEEKSGEIDFSKKLELSYSKLVSVDTLSTNILKLTGEVNR